MSTSRPTATIVVESRHGSTLEIAGALAQRLVFNGFRVDVVEPKVDPDIDADVVVVGSAIYFGKWLKPALRYLDRHATQLSAVPVWLFSSGPLGDESADGGGGVGIDDEYIEHLTARVNARAHRVFAGRLDQDLLGPVEAVVAHAVQAPEGDFRNWLEISEWADEIAAAARLPVAPG